MKKIPVLCIVGPTAAGKTKLAVEMSKKFNGEVISCDSMQIYKHMTIGTAKPTDEEMEGIPHHLINILEPSEKFDVSRFKKLAASKVLEIKERGKLPVLCGGTGLYINSFIDNIDFGEYESDIDYRKELEKKALEHGGKALLNMLYEVDKITAERLHENDLKRIIRALEIYRVTKVPQSEHIKNSRNKESPYSPLFIGLTFKDRQKLYERIEKRVDIMMENGLLEEVRNLLSIYLPKDSTAMQAIGYKELAGYLRGEESLGSAVDKIKKESRRYAKRQLTWFKKDMRINWIFLDDFSEFKQILPICYKLMENNVSI